MTKNDRDKAQEALGHYAERQFRRAVEAGHGTKAERIIRQAHKRLQSDGDKPRDPAA